MRSLFVIVVACIFLSACGTTTPAQRAALNAEASRPVVCTSDRDCRVKWSRAIAWVSQNSAYKFKTQTDFLIQTMGPLSDDTSSAFTITRTANADGTATIDFAAGCDNFLGCIPSVLEEKASFVHFVMGPAS